MDTPTRQGSVSSAASGDEAAPARSTTPQQQDETASLVDSTKADSAWESVAVTVHDPEPQDEDADSTYQTVACARALIMWACVVVTFCIFFVALYVVLHQEQRSVSVKPITPSAEQLNEIKRVCKIVTAIQHSTRNSQAYDEALSQNYYAYHKAIVAPASLEQCSTAEDVLCSYFIFGNDAISSQEFQIEYSDNIELLQTNPFYINWYRWFCVLVDDIRQTHGDIHSSRFVGHIKQCLKPDVGLANEILLKLSLVVSDTFKDRCSEVTLYQRMYTLVNKPQLRLALQIFIMSKPDIGFGYATVSGAELRACRECGLENVEDERLNGRLELYMTKFVAEMAFALHYTNSAKTQYAARLAILFVNGRFSHRTGKTMCSMVSWYIPRSKCHGEISFSDFVRHVAKTSPTDYDLAQVFL